MKRIFLKFIPILLLLTLVLCASACDTNKFWGYVTGEGIGSFDGEEDNSGLVYNQGTIEGANNSLADTIEEILPSVVDVTCTATYVPLYGKSWLMETRGSGVIIDEDEEYLYILGSYQTMYFPETAVGQNRQLYNLSGVQARVTFMDGEDCTATFLKFIPSADTGLIRVTKSDVTSDYTVATVPTTWALEEGDEIIAISNPLGVLGGTVTTGIVSAEREMQLNEYVTMEVLQTDAELTVNSGGILFTKSGRFVGVVYAKAVGEGIEGLNFAIPADNILEAYHTEGILEGIVIGE